MAKLTAKALDTWLNTLNKAHLVPVNAATFLRSVIAKQLGGPGFRPAPVTEKNFTDAELDALLHLSRKDDGSFGPITHDSYSSKIDYDYGNGEGQLGSFFSPLKSVSTAVGQMGYDKTTNSLVDTFDFNRSKVFRKDNGDGTVTLIDSTTDDDDNTETIPKEKVKERLQNYYNRGESYANLRNNAHRFAHQDSDPDDSKIKVRVSIDKALKRLGLRSGTYDLTKPMSRKELILKAIATGGLTGAPVGAALGALSGTLSLIDRRKRKHWKRQLLTHSLAGAAIGGIASGALGGLAANELSKRFGLEKSSAARRSTKKSRSEMRERAIANILAYGIPSLLLVGSGAYAGIKGKRIIDRLLEDKGSEAGIDLVDI